MSLACQLNVSESLLDQLWGSAILLYKRDYNLLSILNLIDHNYYCALIEFSCFNEPIAVNDTPSRLRSRNKVVKEELLRKIV